MQPLSPQARTWAEVDLGALCGNLRTFRERAGGRARVMAVVKADAYGHGAVPVSRALVGAGVDMLGVATVGEAMELRHAGLRCPIMMLSCILPAEARAAVQLGLILTVADISLARALDEEAGKAGAKAKVHLKVDTGMGRIGVAAPAAAALVRELLGYQNLELDGIFTHLATADEEDTGFAVEQLALFMKLLALLERDGIRIPVCHAAGSAAVIRFDESRFNLVRPGLGIYGLYGSAAVPRLPGLRPVLALHSRIAFLKSVPAGTPVSYGRRYITAAPATLATIGIGYGDGLPRSLTNKLEVLVRGQRCRQVGTICMDQCVVDVTGVPEELAAGEPVTIIGRQGDEEVSAEEFAGRSGTIPYETVTALTGRVPRIYRSS